MNVEQYITDYMMTTGSSSTEALHAADQVVEVVNQGAIQENLLQMIQAMGEYLTSDDDFVRSKVSVLVSFYCDRLSEQTCVPTILEGLVALTGFPHFNGVNAVLVAKRLIECVDMQRYPQVTRNSAYHVIQNLVDKYANALKSINNEFVFGYCQLMDGEKDPRNLMSAFKITRSIIEQFDITSHVEDLFEITFCYFPITFKPPPDDPYGITADDLKVSLRMCLASTPLFAKFAVPLILEKLTSTSGSAKKDSMETLALCAPVYGSTALLPNVEELLDSLKIEVFHASDQTLEDAAVDSIRSLVGAISSGDNSTDVSVEDPLAKSLKSLLDECLANLKDSESKNVKQTGRILRAVASASDHAFHVITDSVMPLLLHSYRETEIATRKKTIMEIFLELLEASRVVYGSANDDHQMDQDIISPLLPYKDRFFGMFESSLLASNEYNGLRLCGLHGLKLMILHANYLTENEVGVAIQSFNKIILEETDDELRSAALNSLESISVVDPSSIADQTIPAIINRLPQSSLEKQVIGFPQLLYALKSLCPEPTVFKFGLPLLMEKFDIICESETDAHYAQAIISTILDIIHIKSTQDHDDIIPCFESIVWSLITKVVIASLGASKTKVILLSDILETISLLSAIIYRKLDASQQQVNVDKLFKLFLEGDISVIGLSAMEFAPLKANSSEAQHDTVQLFGAIVASSRKEVSLPVKSIQSFLDDLVSLTLSSGNTILQNSLVRIIGSVINKLKSDESLSSYIQSITAKLEYCVDQRTSEKQNALLIYIWITKALIMKTQTLGYQLTDKLIEWCGIPISELNTPQNFDSLLGDDHLALNKSCFSTMTILYKQRFFSFCLPKLIHGFRSFDEDIKYNYLIALSYLLKNVPKQILLNELPPVS
ncbi:Dos2-interacting transcription regulator of RNA-Pol-II-domain-containing protein [Halteromyces radiatus]|uniref:Dos2-interacting transcription regulator of RNA-Pol-II-domain-containing protein n=1 Tax=Halteromyces radiatus TaxID=101107 RepID=UPI002220868A|nr:Dos2-interacting transcription regulator of RNA-Pol-II-domain-containing protein [Halteromyces radiatus]KAI8099496.1 Dos2-interacting transcription regulator of RNA-Pol-II-domain-containing protein [Halteromyces radiatus]